MPQPYPGDFAHEPNSLKNHPEFAKHIGLVISIWSGAEVTLGQILAAMLQSDSGHGFRMYLSIKGEAGRIDAIKAVAKTYLPPAKLPDFVALMDAYRKTGSQRDRIAHAIWGVVEGRKHFIVYIPYKDILGLIGTSSEDVVRTSEALDTLKNTTMKYTVADFVDIETRILRLQGRLTTFLLSLWPNTPSPAQ